MKIVLDTQIIDDANLFGETLREYIFKERFGCYSCFDLIDEFALVEDVKVIEKLQLVLGIHKSLDVEEYDFSDLRELTCYYSNGSIHVGWYWDGDGTLAIIEGSRCVVNEDCKKDYTWEWVTLDG